MQQSQDKRQQAAKRQGQKAGSAPSAVYRTNEPLRCPHCGSPVGPADRFCEECGASLQTASAETTSAVEEPQPIVPAIVESPPPTKASADHSATAAEPKKRAKKSAKSVTPVSEESSDQPPTEAPSSTAPPTLPLILLQQKAKKKEGKQQGHQPETKAAIPAPKGKRKSTPKNAMLLGILERSKTKANVDVPQLAYKETVERQRHGWVCNWCGCWHHQPSECSRPDLGGTWQYRTRKTIKITKV